MATESFCRLGCRCGAALCLPTRKPPADCWSPARRRAPSPSAPPSKAPAIRARASSDRSHLGTRSSGSHNSHQCLATSSIFRRNPRASKNSPSSRIERSFSRCRARDARRRLAGVVDQPRPIGLKEGCAVPGRARAGEQQRHIGPPVSSPIHGGRKSAAGDRSLADLDQHDQHGEGADPAKVRPASRRNRWRSASSGPPRDGVGGREREFEPTWDRLAAPFGFEVRTPHQGRFSSICVGRKHRGIQTSPADAG